METKRQEESSEHLCLKLLLNKWKLIHLLDYFLAQKINVDILKMMKPHHIGDALNCFPLGDRIRFEYELENWRDRMGIPLNSRKLMTALSENSSKEPDAGEVLETFENEESVAKLEKPNASNSTPQPPTSNERATAATPAVTPLIFKKVIKLPQNSQKEIATPGSLRLSRLCSQAPATQATTSSVTKKRPTSTFLPPTELIANPLNLDARTILMQCVPRGPQLIQTYETRRCFTAAERGELINLFARFFYHHSIHLSLKMSHALENQILKLFPGERLKDYRTEKRGRIYIRLGNIKNFRARSDRAKDRQRSQQQFVISCVEEDDEQAIMVEDKVLSYEESNSPDHILCDDFKTDVESNSADNFLCTEIKTEEQEDSVFEPQTQLVETENNDESFFE